MSIGNLKDSGNQGNNFPWQLKMLEGLQCICDEVKAINTDTDDIEQLLADLIAELQSGIAVSTTQLPTTLGPKTENNSLSVTIATNETGVQRTPTFLRTVGDGTIAAGAFSMSFASVGTADAIVGGMILKPGETLNFDAGAINNTLASVTYNTTTNPGAELIIITLV